MTRGIEAVSCAFVSGAAAWLGLLWAGARFRNPRRQRFAQGACAAIAIGVVFVPMGGLPLWNWVFSYCPNPSVPMVGLLLVALLRQLGGFRVLQAAEWRAWWAFGAVAGTALYLHPVLPGSADLYYLGWQHAVSVWTMAGLAVVLLAFGNRAGIIFLATLIAYELRILESPNGWDYLVDPFYWVIGLVMAAVHLARTGRALWRQARSGPGPVPVVIREPAAGDGASGVMGTPAREQQGDARC